MYIYIYMSRECITKRERDRGGIVVHYCSARFTRETHMRAREGKRKTAASSCL